MKELRFIHITKTAGTSIEEIAKEKGILYGRYHREYGGWHVFFKHKPKEFKNRYDWFLVVRNPYERIVSEFHCKWGGVGNLAEKYNVDGFNNYIRQKIMHRLPIGGHYSEQYKYIDNDPSIKIHILRFENLEEEFNSLMKTYNLDLKLSKDLNKNEKIFTVKDLSPDNIKLINNIYKKDFEKFNYPMNIIKEKCIRPECNFLKHPDPKNNGGTHCCNFCRTRGTHGLLCMAKLCY
jgi:hypothetical protein